MAGERTLFERLSRAGAVEERSRQVDAKRVLASVLQHLQQMLNVRQGNVSALPMYGMPDFNDMIYRFPDAILEIQRAIKYSIEHYEPRLKSVRIKYRRDESDPLSLSFEIVAQLVAGRERTPAWFETRLDAMGRVSVIG